MPIRFPDVLRTSILALLTLACAEQTPTDVSKVNDNPSFDLIQTTLPASFVFSEYVSGRDYEVVRDIAVDAAGNAYLTGGTVSPNFPTTPGVLQRIHNPGTPETSAITRSDVFITKMDPNGRIIWSTFLGGPNHDRAYGIVVDRLGFVYVAGRAGRNFPVTANALQTTFMGGAENAGYGNQDGFVCKIKPDGSAIVYCTYFGSSDPRIIRDLTVNSAGEVYVASGYSGGVYPPAVAAAFKNAKKGNTDAVAAKISTDGRSLLWARYYGGSGWESNQNSIVVDGAGNPYFLFTTQSTDVTVSPNAFQRRFGGKSDMVIARLDAQTGALVWETYFGGTGTEATETHEFAVDAAGNTYIAATTSSAVGFPTTAGAFRRSYAGGARDIFVAKFSPDGSRILACTLIGGSGDDFAEGIAVDASGNVFFTGSTRSTNFPVTANARQRVNRGANDALAVRFSPNLSTLLYSTYLGGPGYDFGRSASTGPNGFYLGGETTSLSGLSFNATMATFGGGSSDGLIARVVF